LLKRFLASGQDLTFLNINTNSANVFEQKLDYSKVKTITESKLPISLLRYLPLQTKLQSKSIFHSSYMRVSPQKDVLNILTIHDLVHERRLASKFPRVVVNLAQKKYCIKNADAIICISESTKNDLLHFYPNVNPDSIEVIYQGLTDEYYLLDKGIKPDESFAFDICQPYVLYVGDRRYYKNFSIAIETVALLPQHYKLVVAGGGPINDAEAQLLEKTLPNRYEIVKAVSFKKMNILYNYAFCLLYPSIHEGFGFPPLEAMKAGCPAITTNRTSLPEVVGDAGIMISEVTAENFANGILTLENNKLRNEYILKGLEQVKKFTFQETFDKTLNFYQKNWVKKFQ
jgi:glycosyltransferase involved in cell wall biosynthesis